MGGDRGAAHDSINREARSLILSALLGGGDRDMSRRPTLSNFLVRAPWVGRRFQGNFKSKGGVPRCPPPAFRLQRGTSLAWAPGRAPAMASILINMGNMGG